MRCLVFACMFALASPAAIAQDAGIYSANHKLAGCRAAAEGTIRNSTGFDVGWCMGAVLALVATDTSTCAPYTSTQAQAVRVVVAHIDQRPARMHENFLQLALEALRLAWPCR